MRTSCRYQRNHQVAVLSICPDHSLDGLMQERHNSSALAMELHLSCINWSVCCGVLLMAWYLFDTRTSEAKIFQAYWYQDKCIQVLSVSLNSKLLTSLRKKKIVKLVKTCAVLSIGYCWYGLGFSKPLWISGSFFFNLIDAGESPTCSNVR